MSLASILNLQPNTQFTIGTSRLPVTPSYIGWGDPVTDPASALGSLLFDAIYSEEHDQSSIVTDHPVEQGTNITDNVRPLPAKVTLVDRRNYHLFQPLLYQVATAGLNPSDIAYPIRSIVRLWTSLEPVRPA